MDLTEVECKEHAQHGAAMWAFLLFFFTLHELWNCRDLKQSTPAAHINFLKSKRWHSFQMQLLSIFLGNSRWTWFCKAFNSWGICVNIFFAPARGNQTVGTFYQGVVIIVNHQHPVIRKKERKEMSKQYIFTFVTSKSGTVIPHAVICNALIQNLSSWCTRSKKEDVEGWL